MALTIHPTKSAPTPVGAAPRVVMTDPVGSPVARGWIEGRDHWLQVPHVATFRFRPGADEIAAYPVTPGSAEELVDAYRTIALPLALQVSGWEVLHASAIASPDGVVAVCAHSGTGKTTTAYGLARRGHTLWADDAVVFESREDGPVLTHPLPFDPNLRAESRAHFGLGHTQVAGGDGEGDPMPLGAVLVLDRVAEDSVAGVDRLRPTEALSALLPHSYRFDLADIELRRRTVRSYLELVAQVPVLRVSFVPALDRLDALFDDIERALAELNDEPR